MLNITAQYHKEDNSRGVVLLNKGESVTIFWFGDDEFFKTEADAREAAELVKAFFEAKESGKVALLVVDEKQCLGERCVLDGECFSRDKGLCWFDPANKWPPVQNDDQRPKRQVIDLMSANNEVQHLEAALKLCQSELTKWRGIADGYKAIAEKSEAFQIAHMAAMIFAQNKHDIDERRAVESAAKILHHAKQTV